MCEITEITVNFLRENKAYFYNTVFRRRGGYSGVRAYLIIYGKVNTTVHI